MNNTTHQNQIEKKPNQKKKRTILILSIIALLFAIGQFAPKSDDTNLGNTEMTEKVESENLGAKKKLDSVISVMQAQKEYRISKVQYLPDSTLRIDLSSDKSQVNAQFIDIYYDVLSIGNVAEIEVYIKNKLQSAFGQHTGERLDFFNKNFISSYDGSCRPVELAIKSQMNDPRSYEHNATSVNPLLNGNFEIKTSFRGKNRIGAVVLNNAQAEVSKSGTVVSLNFED